MELSKFDVASQSREHALEVQIPFLQKKRNNVKIVPITLSHLPHEVITRLGKTLAELISDYEKSGQPRPLVVASSDMTHFEDDKTAKLKDMSAIEKISEFDTEGFISTVRDKEISLCGLYPIAVLMELIKEYSKINNTELPETILVDYTNSGNITGETDNVVAYAGVVFTWDKSGVNGK
jgi:AmmeMemoRadiSam system protein B